MADFNLPTLATNYTDFLDNLKDRDADIAKMFDGTTSSNLPVGTKRWSSANSRFEKWDGASWTEIVSKYSINVDKVDGADVNDSGTTTAHLWTAAKIIAQLALKASATHTHDDRYFTETEVTNLLSAKLNVSTYTAADILTKLKTVDGAGSGLDADLLDGYGTTTVGSPNKIPVLDATGKLDASMVNVPSNSVGADELTKALNGGEGVITKYAPLNTTQYEIIPAGWYFFRTAGDEYCSGIVEMSINGAWGGFNTPSGFVVSDGSNVRLKVVSFGGAGNGYFHYRKLGA